ncbi:hypothetical protein JCM8547_001415 [Rhodosporidiobolus lusitaniae]
MTAVSRVPELAWSDKAEGLGLGGISMPVELGGKPQVDPPQPVEQRYQALQKQSRHSPSHSSPPSLAPYAAAVASKSASNLSASLNPAPTPVTARKYSLQNLSGDIISYPMVSRIDLTPTYTPPATVPPVPTSSKPAVKNEEPAKTPTLEIGTSDKRSSKARPPPIRLPTSGHVSFLTPFKGRFGGKDKEPSPDREKAQVDGKDKVKGKPKKTKAENRVEENKAAFAARFPDTLAKTAPAPTAEDDNDEDTLNITLPSKASTAPPLPTFLPPPVPSSLPLERSASRPERVLVPALGAPFGPPSAPSSPTQTQARPSHRRGTSDQSPQVVQDAFARVAAGDAALRPRPATMFSSTPASASTSSTVKPRRPSKTSPPITSGSKASTSEQGAPSIASRRTSRSRSISSAAGMPKPDDAFFPPSVGGSASSVLVSSALHRRPSAVPQPDEAVRAVGIRVKEGAGSEGRELGRAAFPDDGLTVSVRSYHRPDELEVGWVCIPGVDEDGRAFTTYELRLTPRSSSAQQQRRSTSGDAKTPKATHQRPRTPSTSSGSHFFNYRMNGPPPPPISSTGAPEGGSGSPRSGSKRGVSPFQDVPPPPARKHSARSTGSSFSSESSTTGPTTPRRGKLSNASMLSVDLPPFDLDAVLASKHAVPPHSATSATFDHDEEEVLASGLPSPRRRMGRAASYASVAEQYRARQFSIDEEGILNGRAASFSVGPGAVAVPPKSPKHHRFACYIPPVSTGGVDFEALAKEAKRKSQQSLAGSEAAEVLADEPPVPVLPSSAGKQRKQSIAVGSGGIQFNSSFGSSTGPISGATSKEDGLAGPSRSFLASRGRKQSIAPPTALVIPSSSLIVGGYGASPSSAVSHGSGSSGMTPSPLRTANPLDSSHTPTHSRYGHSSLLPRGPSPIPIRIPSPVNTASALPSHLQPSALTPASIASTTPPSPPPAGSFSTAAAASNGKDTVPTLLFHPEASPAESSSSSFGGNAPSRPLSSLSLSAAHHGPGHVHFGSNASSPTPSDDDDDNGEGEDVDEAKLVRARRARRLASKWSDTEEEESEGGEGGAGKEGRGTTSWCGVPDAEETDQE